MLWPLYYMECYIFSVFIFLHIGFQLLNENSCECVWSLWFCGCFLTDSLADIVIFHEYSPWKQRKHKSSWSAWFLNGDGTRDISFLCQNSPAPPGLHTNVLESPEYWLKKCMSRGTAINTPKVSRPDHSLCIFPLTSSSFFFPPFLLLLSFTFISVLFNILFCLSFFPPLLIFMSAGATFTHGRAADCRGKPTSTSQFLSQSNF